MVYVDAFYYKSEYFGEIEDDTQLARLLARASEKIDIITFNRSRNFEKLSQYEQEMIKKAVCCEADAINEYGEQDISLASYSIGDVSISNNTGAQETLISKKAQSYLANTRLLSRIL